MKSYLAIAPLLAIAFALTIASLPGSDGEDEKVFDDGILSYYILDDSTVEVNYYLYESGVTAVVVPETVTHDGVTYTVVEIAYGAFSSADIVSVHIPATVEQLFPESFYGTDIQEIDVDPDNPYYSSYEGILYDYKIRELIRCPTNYGKDVVETPESLASIGRAAFEDCSVTSIRLNEGLILIDTYAFYACRQLTTIYTEDKIHTLPESLSVIGSYSFSSCESLQQIDIPEELTMIGEGAFSSTGLKEVKIPYSIDHIGDHAFSDCKQLKSIESDNSIYPAYDGVLFLQNDLKRLVCYPAGKEDAEYTLTDDVATISPGAFSGCVNLKKVTVGDITTIPDRSFYRCGSLEKVDLSKVSFIGSMAFYNCSNLTSVKFSDSLLMIEYMAFDNTGIESVTVPKSLLSIEAFAFSDCQNLKSFTFPEDSQCEVHSFALYHDDGIEIYIGSDRVKLLEDSLSVGSAETDVMTANVTVPKGYDMPENVCDEFTDVIVSYIGERPYPYENLIGVLACLLVLFAIFKLFRRV